MQQTSFAVGADSIADREAGPSATSLVAASLRTRMTGTPRPSRIDVGKLTDNPKDGTPRINCMPMRVSRRNKRYRDAELAQCVPTVACRAREFS
jgi:hypothetical protein